MRPLEDLRVIEVAGIGPVPFAAMLLAELGANVVRVDRTRPGGMIDPMLGAVGRGRRSVAVDLKHPTGVEVVLRLVETADVLIEGFRPGVAERLGFGPDVCFERNPRLVYGRMTGWGRDGPYRAMAGHDINYIGLVGALHAVGEADRPIPALNLIGDYGGGALFLLSGILAALVDRDRSGGVVVDTAMMDGAASLMSPTYQMRSLGLWEDDRARNLLDGGAPFYRTYRTSDGEWMAVGALEPAFYAALLRGLDLSDADLPGQLERDGWPGIEAAFTDAFSSRSRAEWEATFAGSDACVTPVLSLDEASDHPHNVARGVFESSSGAALPASAFRFAAPGPLAPTPSPGADTNQILEEAGYSAEAIAALREDEAIA